MEGFNPSEDYPQLCSLVTVGWDSVRGRHVKALEDIPIGTVVCFETGTTVSIDDTKCMYCLGDLNNTHDRYCRSCVTSYQRFGAWESPFEQELNNLGMAKIAIRVMLSFDVEDILAIIDEPELRCAKFLDSRLFLSIMALTPSERVDMTPIQPFLDRFVRHLIHSKHPEWSDVKNLRSKFGRCFEAVFRRLIKNAHTVYSIEKTLSKRDSVPCGVGLFPIASIFNHGCRANVNSFFDGNRFIWVSRGILKGEELLDNYGVTHRTHNLEERKEFLGGRGFECICSSCNGNSSNSTLESLLQDEEFEIEEEFDISIYEKVKGKFAVGSRNIERQAEAYLDQEGIDITTRRRLLVDILNAQRARGMYLEPTQVELFVNLAETCSNGKAEIKLKEAYLFSALVRIRYFYKGLHPLMKKIK